MQTKLDFVLQNPVGNKTALLQEIVAKPLAEWMLTMTAGDIWRQYTVMGWNLSPFHTCTEWTGMNQSQPECIFVKIQTTFHGSFKKEKICKRA